MRVLFLAFEFPPLTTAGVFRALQLATGLPREGCTVNVVTVRSADYAAWTGTPLDATFARGLSDTASVRVHRIPSGFPNWYWSVRTDPLGARLAHYGYWGDPVARFWRRPLFAMLDALVATATPDVLLATVPPFGVGVLAKEAARRYRIPWVVDWRDPWTLWRSGPFASYAHYRVARAHERTLLRDANASVATSRVTRDEWIATVPRVDPGRIAVVHTGYDPELPTRARPGPAAGCDSGRVRRIVYVGNFYYDPQARGRLVRGGSRRVLHPRLSYTPDRQDWLYRSPYFFLRGLRRAVERRPSVAGRLRVELAGPVPDWLPGMLRDTGTTDLVGLTGPIPHADAVCVQASADALLLTSARRIGGSSVRPARDYSVAGKLAQYFGLRRPILGVLTAGAMRDLVERSGLGLLADPDDPDAIADQIIRIADGADPAALLRPDESFLESFDRRHTVRQMADILGRVAAEGYRG